MPVLPEVTVRPTPRRGLLVCLLLLAGLIGCSREDGPAQAVEAFLNGWSKGNLDPVGIIEPTGQKVSSAAVLEQIRTLSGKLAERPPALRISGDSKAAGNIETFPVAVDWTLPGDVHWKYDTKVQASKGEQGWRVIWEPAVVQAQLTDGDALAVRRKLAPRAAVLDAAGKPLVQRLPIVVVGVEPQQVTDVKALVRKLGAAFESVDVQVDLSDLPGRIRQAKPDAFVEVVQLRKTVYDKIKPVIHPLPGTQFRTGERDLPPTREFARALLGTVDPVLKEDMDAKPGVYEDGDTVGHGGLQGRYEDRLRGAPGLEVVIVRKGAENAVETIPVHEAPPTAGNPVKTTLDQKVQKAADRALGAEKRRTALVALRVRDGAVLAVANGPGGGAANLAFTAQVPPGSTFKMVAALGLLDAGAVTLDGRVPCPRKFRVEGRTFTNAHNFALGNVPFRRDFSESCNTAFAALAPKLGPDGLAAAGGTLGLGGTWDMGVDVFSGKVSSGGPPAERAAAAFGQGTTIVSPLAIAAATAGVARGQWQQPTVLLDPAPAKPAPPGPQLKEGSVQPLRTMMREVVTTGTATALRDAPGGKVYGKTGTAEYDDNKAHAHGWFAGWQGDIAFAVFVEKGGDSDKIAVPLAERFLRELSRP